MTEEHETRSRDVVAVVALARDSHGRVLLASYHEDGPWSLIGGEVADGEDPQSAASRFASDECGVTIEVTNAIHHLSGDKYRVLYECGDDVAYEATVYDVVVRAQTESAPLRTKWFERGDIASAQLDEFASAALTDLGLRL